MISKKHVFITSWTIRTASNTVFIFGDNLEHRGEGGQAAVARKFVASGKAFGIPTKRSPEKVKAAYFADREDEIAAVRASFGEILKTIKKKKKIVFFPGIGEGRAELKTRSPLIYSMIRDFIIEHEKIDFDKLRGKKS